MWHVIQRGTCFRRASGSCGESSGTPDYRSRGSPCCSTEPGKRDDATSDSAASTFSASSFGCSFTGIFRRRRDTGALDSTHPGADASERATVDATLLQAARRERDSTDRASGGTTILDSASASPDSFDRASAAAAVLKAARQEADSPDRGSADEGHSASSP